MKCAYLIVLMATYWMTEAMPLPITSMIPMVTTFQYVISVPEIVFENELENFKRFTRSVFHFWASCQLVKLPSITSMLPTTWWVGIYYG